VRWVQNRQGKGSNDRRKGTEDPITTFENKMGSGCAGIKVVLTRPGRSWVKYGKKSGPKGDSRFMKELE